MNRKKIVIIDDEPDLCSLMQAYFQDLDRYNVFTAHDGEEGNRICLQEKPDLIFLDYVMPKQDGGQVLKSLRACPDLKKTVIILMSGLGEAISFEGTELWEWILEDGCGPDHLKVRNNRDWVSIPLYIQEKIGAQIYLPKPFHEETLLLLTYIVFSDSYRADIV